MALILNLSQAQAVARIACDLNNVAPADYLLHVKMGACEVLATDAGEVQVVLRDRPHGFRTLGHEGYVNFDLFLTAYGVA